MKCFAKSAALAGMLAVATQSFAAVNNNKPNHTASIAPAEREKIETVVHEYLLRNPEVLIEVMQLLQRKQLEQQQQTVQQTQKIASTFAKALFHNPNDPVVGNPKGTVTLVEFFDYQCPHCVDMAPVMEAIVKANPNVRVIYKEFPIRGPISELAAKAALAANKQGKYAAFSHALLTSNNPLTKDSILDIAKSTGLNVDKLKKDMDDPSIKDHLNANTKLAQDLKLFGTPAFFIGKTNLSPDETINYYPGSVDQKHLQEALDKTK